MVLDDKQIIPFFQWLPGGLSLFGVTLLALLVGGIFVLAFVGTAIIALGSVSYRAYRAATINPVKSLRYE